MGVAFGSAAALRPFATSRFNLHTKSRWWGAPLFALTVE